MKLSILWACEILRNSASPTITATSLEIVAAQQKILSDIFDTDNTRIPQVWCVYRELDVTMLKIFAFQMISHCSGQMTIGKFRTVHEAMLMIVGGTSRDYLLRMRLLELLVLVSAMISTMLVDLEVINGSIQSVYKRDRNK